MVRAAGLEPARDHSRRILSPLRLPIPPRPLKTGGPYSGPLYPRRERFLIAHLFVCRLKPDAAIGHQPQG